MFAFRGMVIKMSKIAHIFVFSADGGIKVVTVRAKHLTAPENLLEFFQKMVWLIDFRVTVCEISRVEISKKSAESAKKETLYFQGLASCSESNNP